MFRHFKPWKTKEFILALIVLLLSALGITSERTINQALYPQRQSCQVPADSFVSPPISLSFKSNADQTLLKGWFLPANDAKGTIILAHGYRQNRLPNIPAAINLVNSALEAGYNFLLFDFRNCGDSATAPTTFGLLEAADLLAAVDLAKTQLAPDSEVYVLGISMGAVAAMLAAAETTDISALIVDSAFADLGAYFRQHLNLWTGLPDFPFNRLLLALGPRLSGFDLLAVSPISIVPQLTQPILIIHSRNDKVVPAAEALRLYAALASPEKDLWLVKQAKHGFSFAVEPEEYKERVLSFLAKVSRKTGENQEIWLYPE